MADRDVIAERFESVRPHLTSVAYAMLGSVSEAEDAVQEAWIRLDHSEVEAIEDLRGWLTTVVGRICLDMFRARKSRPVDYIGTWLPEPIVVDASSSPEEEAILSDSVSMALLVVLESLSPAERLAFVLHDVFGMPFDDIAGAMDRSIEAVRQLASRARRRVREAPQPDRDLGRQRRVVDAFLSAARTGDFDGLLAVLAPDVVLRFDIAADVHMPTLVGAESVANHVMRTAPRFISLASPALVNGTAGALFGTRQDPLSVLAFTVVDGRIAALNLVVNPQKLRHLSITSAPTAAP
jgi:RNA polymerase sigma-70 factor (ECF subfamily)